MISKKLLDRERKYCCEDLSKIENYQQAIDDKTHMWHCHHRLEVQGQFTNSVELLKRCGMYWNRPANELIFLTHSDHRKLHSKGKPCSEETRRKISVARKGRLSEDTMKRMSESLKGKKASEEARRKMSEAHKGKHHSEETRQKMSESRMGKKRSEETRQKMSESHKGRRWFNNGVKSVMAYECPEGFKPGRLYVR